MVSYPDYMYFQGSKLQSRNETRLAMNIHVGAHDLHTQLLPHFQVFHCIVFVHLQHAKYRGGKPWVTMPYK